jgi:mannitol-specific phosphotransferase system IIBC component
MRAYFRLFVGLLIPLSALFMVASVFYFKIEYDFTKAMRLGVLVGLFIAIAVSFFTALLLIIIRRGRQPKKDIFSGVRELKKRRAKKSNLNPSTQNEDTIITEMQPFTTSSETVTTTQENIMLLMNNTIAFKVLLYAIEDQKLGQLTDNKESEGQVVIQTDKSMIKIIISPLTKYTSQMQIDAEVDDMENKQKIVTYMKEKGYSFTQY